MPNALQTSTIAPGGAIGGGLVSYLQPGFLQRNGRKSDGGFIRRSFGLQVPLLSAPRLLGERLQTFRKGLQRAIGQKAAPDHYRPRWSALRRAVRILPQAGAGAKSGAATLPGLGVAQHQKKKL